MPLKGYFLWMGLILCALLFGTAFVLGPAEVKPNGVQELPLEIRKLRAQQAKVKAAPRTDTRWRNGAS
jgi:hypothetical protein